MIQALDVAEQIYPDDHSAAIALEAHIHVLRAHGWRVVKDPTVTEPHGTEII